MRRGRGEREKKKKKKRDKEEERGVNKYEKEKKKDYVDRFKEHPIRKLNKMTRELWQNRIKWTKR